MVDITLATSNESLTLRLANNLLTHGTTAGSQRPSLYPRAVAGSITGANLWHVLLDGPKRDTTTDTRCPQSWKALVVRPPRDCWRHVNRLPRRARLRIYSPTAARSAASSGPAAAAAMHRPRQQQAQKTTSSHLSLARHRVRRQSTVGLAPALAANSRRSGRRGPPCSAPRKGDGSAPVAAREGRWIWTCEGLGGAVKVQGVRDGGTRQGAEAHLELVVRLPPRHSRCIPCLNASGALHPCARSLRDKILQRQLRQRRRSLWRRRGRSRRSCG